MRFSTTFKSAAIVIAAATVSFAAPASAHDNGFQHRHQSNGNNQLAGGAIGAVAGGLIGNQIAGRGSRTEGAILGAVIGGAAGVAIAGDGRSNNVGYSNGYYNQQTGYYNAGYAPSQGYYNQGYNSYPVSTTYRTVYSGPSYYGYPGGYYGGSNVGLSINLGNGGFFNRGFSNNRRFSNNRSFSNNRGVSNRRFNTSNRRSGNRNVRRNRGR